MADQAHYAQEHAQTVGRHTQEHAHGLLQKLQQHKPTGSQVLGFITLLTAGCILLFLGGLAVTVTIIALVLLTPVFIFFSPVLVPAGFLLFLAVSGMVIVGGFIIAAFSASSWLYKYFKGSHPPGSEKIDYVCARIQHTAAQMRGKACDVADTFHGNSKT